MSNASGTPAVMGTVIGVAIALGVVACAAPSQRDAAPMSPAQTAAPAHITDQRHDDIRELWIQIRDWRKEAGMSVEPPFARADLLTTSVDDIRECRSDRNTVSDSCQDTCTLKDAICDNAEEICRIAKDLGDDPWAQGKCKSAKSSCREATEKCCGCIDKTAGTHGVLDSIQ